MAEERFLCTKCFVEKSDIDIVLHVNIFGEYQWHIMCILVHTVSNNVTHKVQQVISLFITTLILRSNVFSALIAFV